MDGLADRIAAVRRFNRVWTRHIGVLDETVSGGPFSLTEVRVLYEIAHGPASGASALGRRLGLDGGYLSRILRGFEQHGLIARAPDPDDARRRVLRLTEAGAETLAPLEARSDAATAALLAPIPDVEQESLVASLAAAERLLGPAAPWTLRPPRAGDLGWVVSRHGAVYAREYGWGAAFEAEVAGIAARFLAHADPARERGWIAERHGARLGSVLLVRRSDELAQLRLLLVEPCARKQGIAGRLVAECLAFAREAGYRRIMLETVSILTTARALYAGAGFRMTEARPGQVFGEALVAETWERDL